MLPNMHIWDERKYKNMNKKLLLSLGSIAAIAAPVATVVACGSNDEKKKDNTPETGQTPDTTHTPNGAQEPATGHTPDAGHTSEGTHTSSSGHQQGSMPHTQNGNHAVAQESLDEMLTKGSEG